VSEIETFAANLALPVADRLPAMPAPSNASLELKRAFRAAVQRERDRRGDIVTETQVYPLVRAVEGFRDIATAYSRAFKLVADDAAGVLVDELVEARGEDKDGIPDGRLYVPDADGSFIKVAPKTLNRHDIDSGQVIAVVALWMAAEWDRDPAEHPEEFAVAVASRVLEMVGAAKLQVSHAKTLVALLKAKGEHDLAATAESAIRTTRELKGVTVDRITEDQMKRARAQRKKAS
jgi:hypothetical protein